MLKVLKYSIRKEGSKNLNEKFKVILLKKKDVRLNDYVKNRTFNVYIKDFLIRIVDCIDSLPPEVVIMLEHISTLSFVKFYREENKVEIGYGYRRRGTGNIIICLKNVSYNKLKSFFE